MTRFSNKVAIVTGSSEGIGLAVAAELLGEGATVVVNGRDVNKLRAAVATLQNSDGSAVYGVAGDVADPDCVENLVAATLQRFGSIDVLVNNAGGGTDVRWIEDIDDADWQRTLDFNLGSVFAVCRAVVPHMRAQGYGRIVNVSSVAGRHKGRLSGPQYSASKAGILGLTRHLAWDLAGDNITVNAIAPGFVMTERALRKWESRAATERDEMLSQVPMRRFAETREIARAILFLASDDASYITGVSLDVNGGSFMS